MQHKVRVWDLPTRLFHWSLAATMVALVVTAKVGGNAMQWHLQLGQVMLALLVFRLVWGLVGGHWSRFTSFMYSPTRLWRYLRGQDGDEAVGHSPLGALSVFALLGVSLAQVVSGLLSDDEISFAGPLARYVSGEWVGQATWYHSDVGQYLLIGLVVLHVLVISFYALLRRSNLVHSMLHGDKLLDRPVAASRDDMATRSRAALVATLSAALAWWVFRLGVA